MSLNFTRFVSAHQDTCDFHGIFRCIPSRDLLKCQWLSEGNFCCNLFMFLDSMKDMGILTSIFLIIGVCPMSTVYINITKTGEWKPMNFKLFLGWSSKPPQKGTCIANPVYSLTKKLCPPNPWIIKSNLDTESDGEQKSLRTEISTVDRTTLRSLLSCTFKNPSRCCFWMAWKTPLDLSSIGALQFSARNIQNSVWKPFLLHVEKSSCCPLWKNYFVTTNWEVQWFCFKYPKIRLNSSNFSDFPMSSSRISIRQQTSSA